MHHSILSVQQTAFDWASINAVTTIIYTAITGIGTWFIVATFRQQRDINANQQSLNELQRNINQQQIELNNIALSKHIRDIRPLFAIKKYDAISMEIELLFAVALSTNIFFYDSEGKIIKNSVLIDITLLPGIFMQTIVLNTLPPLNFNIDFKLADFVYQDEDKRYYAQPLKWHADRKKYQFDWPFMTTKEKVMAFKKKKLDELNTKPI